MSSGDATPPSSDEAAYAEAKKVATDGDPETRRRLAADGSAPPEILYYLASDESVPVRKAVAANLATPVQADFILSNDAEASIRMDLASKIGLRLGYLDEEVDSALYAKVNKVLGHLITDQLHTVRAIVAEEVKRLDNVPKGVVTKLARDAEASVSVPILEHSPLLEDAELIEIIVEGVRDEAVTAIARRDGIGVDVSQSIANTGSVVAVGALLENDTADIAPATLDDITELASDHEPLHRPLSRRDDLPEPVLRRMAGFVGAAIVEDLISRYPLLPAAQEQLRAAVGDRIKSSDITDAGNAGDRPDGHRILLVDDDSTMRMLIRQIIESFLVADVTSLSDGDKALARIEQGYEFDLIICDWMMPNMSGIEFLRALRGRGDDTPFVMLTARKDVDSIVAAQNDGVDAFIAKPVTGNEIQSKLRVLLR